MNNYCKQKIKINDTNTLYDTYMVSDIAKKLYTWERNWVEPKTRDFLSRDECMALVESASKYAGIPTPNIRISKAANMPCRAIPSKWQIVIAAWGRTPVTILHEVAHLATLSAISRGEDPHGPTFLAKVINFYTHFLNIDQNYLIQTAEGAGLKINHASIKMQKSTFFEIDF